MAGRLGDYLASRADTSLGSVLVAPFAVFAKVILTREHDLPLLGWSCLAVAMVSGLAWLTVALDARMERLSRRRERNCYQTATLAEHGPTAATSLRAELIRIPWCGGAGPLAWRQAKGLQCYAGRAMLALVVPGALSCLPLLYVEAPRAALVHVVGALVFYTCLLLPPALRFDFRRDLDRLLILKSLPIHSRAVVWGQLAVPVATATALQLAVLTMAALWRSLPPTSVAAAAALLAVVNVVIFALENLLFLLYPYRLQEESVRIVLRATLAFTAKGLLLTAALGVVYGWSLAAQWITATAANHALLGNRQIVFGGGLWFLLGTAAFLATNSLARAYQRFDPSQDVPA